MDPITMALVATVTLATSTQRPKWEDSTKAANPHSTLQVELSAPRTTFVTAMASAIESVAMAQTPPAVAAPVTAQVLKERLFQQLMSYMPVGDAVNNGDTPSRIEDILIANQFLRKLPGSIPLPGLMRNSEGHIGMYWDNDRVYIDVDVDSDTTVSVYTRVRATDAHKLLEDVVVNDIDSNWYEENIGRILEQNFEFA